MGEGRGCCVPRRVLKDIEVRVEVRNVGPLDAVEIVHGANALLRAHVESRETQIDPAQFLPRECLAPLGRLRGRPFELRKKRLPEKRRADPLEPGRQQRQALLIVGRLSMAWFASRASLKVEATSATKIE